MKKTKNIFYISCVILLLSACNQDTQLTDISLGESNSSHVATFSEASVPELEFFKLDTSEVSLDKTYINERFAFEVDYPSNLDIEEEDYLPPPDDHLEGSIDQGILIYLTEEYWIRVYGSGPSIQKHPFERDYNTSTFVTTEGFKGELNSCFYDDGMIHNIYFLDESRAVNARMSIDVFIENQALIESIVKSVRLKN